MPRKTPAKPRRPSAIIPIARILDKLGVKPDQKILILGVNDGAFINDIQPFNPDFTERQAICRCRPDILQRRTEKRFSPPRATA